MAPNRAGEESEPAPAVAAEANEDVAEILQRAIERQFAALRADSGAMHRQLDTIRSDLQTAVLADVMALIVQTEVPEHSELQRRAQAIQVELTQRRQETAIGEWRRKLIAAEQEAERQRGLFARLEADFERRSADFDRHSADFERRSADFERRLAEFEQRSAEFDRCAAGFETSAAASHQAEETLRSALAERDGALAAAVQARSALEQRVDRLAVELSASTELNESRRQLVQTLEQDLAQARLEKSHLDEEMGQLQSVLAEAERRVEELRNSRWRQLGIGLGLAKRATFEK